ncbi:hypothetical protein L0337_34340 [candidate division KSB1 bacterium]|nr:hypothetical protein [candidate division KSB1 bacterium]
MRTLFIFPLVFSLIGLSSAGESAAFSQTAADTTKSDTVAAAVAAAASAKLQKPDTSQAEADIGIAKKISQAQPKIEWSISFAKIFWAAAIFLAALLSFKCLTRLLEFVAERRANLRLAIKRLIPTIRILG